MEADTVDRAELIGQCHDMGADERPWSGLLGLN
jgi:hypothetical protein